MLLLNTVENIVSKWEIGNYKQLLLLTQCFQKVSAICTGLLDEWTDIIRF